MRTLAAVLAFDTATEHTSIALALGGGRAATRVWVREAPGGAQASATLIPGIFALLGEAGIGLRSLDAIAFGRGPGAFTGLRTACSVAQGLAWGAGLPVLAVDTLLAVAEDARTADGGGAPGAGSPPRRQWVAMDARMNEIYAAQYAYERVVDADLETGDADGRWTVLDAPMLITPDALNRRWQAEPPAHVAGNALAAFAAQLDVCGARLSPNAMPRARAMLPLARALWAGGGAADAALALPLYLRDKVALTTAERDAVHSARRAAASAEPAALAARLEAGASP